MATIAKIIGACQHTYSDSGEKSATIRWVDTKGKVGTTSGNPDNTHMKALLKRARREHVRVHRGWTC